VSKPNSGRSPRESGILHFETKLPGVFSCREAETVPVRTETTLRAFFVSKEVSQMTDEYYELDEITTREDFLFATEDYYDFRVMVGLGLSLVPNAIVDEVLKNCVYFPRQVDQLGFHLPSKFIQGRDVIVIYHHQAQVDQDLYTLAVMHETAHYVLQDALYDKDVQTKEEATNDLVLKWLASYESAFPETMGRFEGIKEWIQKAR
jgi:hypothetical protein